MTLGAGAGERRDVAVGGTREEAAAAFGEFFDDALFTSYDDFDAEVDLSVLRSVGLVAGDGLTAVLPRVLAVHNEAGAPALRVLVGLTPDLRHRDAAEELLAAHPSITFSGVLRSGENVLLPLEDAGQGGPPPVDTILEQLPEQGVHRRAPAAPEPEPDPGPGPRPEPSSPPRRQSSAVEPDPAPVSWDRRRLNQVGALAGGLLLVAAVVLTVVGLAAGTDGILVTLVLFLALTQCLVLLGIVYVVRLLRGLTQRALPATPPVDPDELQFRKQVRRRTERLVRLSEEAVRLQREDLVAGQKARLEVAGVRKRVMSLGKLLSRTGAAARDERGPGA